MKPGENNKAIFYLSHEKPPITKAHFYTLEEHYELYLMSRAVNSLTKMLADVPLYDLIDTAAIPFVISLLTECIEHYFASLNVTKQGNEAEDEAKYELKAFCNTFKSQEGTTYNIPKVPMEYVSAEECKKKGGRKGNFRRKDYDDDE